ncbi:MAG TPA: V-type ATP synthase subunit D [Bacillota bacterium]|nr:V-type ATP synthase subunit D [Bacillota bacterium]
MATRVNPTRMELSKAKKRLKTAARGHKLLKDKQDEMARQFMIYIRRNRELREQIGRLLSGAMGHMALAQAEMGESALEEALFVSASGDGAQRSLKNVMSVNVPELTAAQSTQQPVTYGFAFTSDSLDDAVIAMNSLMPKLYELAAVEKTCDMLADEMERTRRRVNALEYVMIPGLKDTIKYISMKLEDNERGNLTRMMKVKDMMTAAEAE